MTAPWTFESGNFDFSQNVENILLRNELIDQYLTINQRDKKLFLVGPKGIGKTFLLSYKSYLFRKLHSTDVKFSPSKELTENLIVFFSQFSKEEIVKFQTPDIWENIWKFALLSVSCKTYGISIEEELGINNEDFSSVSSTLNFILSDRRNLVKTISTKLPKLISISRRIQSSVIIFIDGIDQAVDVLVDKNFYDYDTYSDIPLKVWSQIHVGVAKSIYDISQLNSHIKIYTTLRSEAFKLIPGGMSLNLEGFATNLNYSINELKTIFINNIIATDEKKLVNREAKDIVEKFLGYSEMPHPFVHQEKESSLDFILRHTLGRPREIVYLGNRLFYEKISKPDYKTIDEQERITDIRYFINEKSEEIIGNYLNEIIPSFDEEYLIKFLKKIQSNVFHHKILSVEERNFLGICYNTGLVGVINQKNDKNGNRIKVQYFKKAGDYLYHKLNYFPESEYYITHPILDCYFLKIFDLDFYNKKNIIGNNYEFKEIKYIYDYAISYSGLDRHVVEAVTLELKAKGLRIFYDKDFEKNLVGEDLIDYLHEVYKHSAKNVIVFLSSNYINTKWTSFEWSTIKQKLVNDYTSNFLKIVKIDSSKTPDIVETRAYIDGKCKTPQEIADLLN
ncbi:TIR domain-containing protein [Telluribacter sp. SYSU D00476]|uniref:TIR domain-containing protein n=1 Tax=Telluribacter sp. SYSU D00476 TaxID=2811430 RepID=UPI001FF2BF07|nr:TIR domain-containing protein [Telluribacter sp. SYSU D00476]